MRPSSTGVLYPLRKVRNSETSETGIPEKPIVIGVSELSTLGVQTKRNRNQTPDVRNCGGRAGPDRGGGTARRSAAFVLVSDFVGAVSGMGMETEELRARRKPIIFSSFRAYGFAGFGVSDFLEGGLWSADLQSLLAPRRPS